MVDLAVKYNIFKKVSTRIELPDGRKAYEKVIYKDPEKYFTDEIMWELEKVVSQEFKYGSTPEEEEKTEADNDND